MHQHNTAITNHHTSNPELRSSYWLPFRWHRALRSDPLNVFDDAVIAFVEFWSFPMAVSDFIMFRLWQVLEAHRQPDQECVLGHCATDAQEEPGKRVQGNSQSSLASLVWCLAARCWIVRNQTTQYMHTSSTTFIVWYVLLTFPDLQRQEYPIIFECVAKGSRLTLGVWG